MSAGARETYPDFPTKHWWALRKVWDQRAMPSGTVTPDYLSNVLDVTPSSAKDNIIPGLRATGLIDEDDRVTQLARRWHDDEEYPAVCKEIRESLYPAELRESFPGPDIERERVQRWFRQRTGYGASAAYKMTTLFELLTDTDPSKQSAPKPKAAPPARKRVDTKALPKATRSTSEPAAVVAEPVQGSAVTLDRRPSLHIDIQIHISPASDEKQIEHIFASMAKYLNLGEPQDVE